MKYYWELYKKWWNDLNHSEATAENIIIFGIVMSAHIALFIALLIVLFSTFGAWGFAAIGLILVMVAVFHFIKYIKDQDEKRN